MASTLGKYNPFRYRGYVCDQETGLYYLQSRYYNPNICRFISADSISYLGADGTVQSYNLFAYCKNNPVNYRDSSGHAVETVFDIISLGSSIAGVAVNPLDPWAWLGLIGDAADVAIPCVGGLGEAIKALKALGAIDDTLDVTKVTQNTLELVSTAAHTHSVGGDFVYLSHKGDLLEYVGITNDFGRRKTEWSKVRDIHPYIDYVDRNTARYVEQIIITLLGKNGNILSNIRNGIGKRGKLFNGYTVFFSSFF